MNVKVNVFYRTDQPLPLLKEYDISGYEFLDFDDKIAAIADATSLDPELQGKKDLTFQLLS
ncbi:hypothetical protein O5W85_27235 (plasmid) [Klebsiella pneumoniae]|jgi:hypothetical protein|uniref:hypothetical protein n=1 Tax=Klebsiella pneumoniae TaxID=573 RepID=UPI000427317F|nr:hypothetical protein [Klebsiella pneumoniae]ELA0881552.1 hypothetical protein [Klebsiella variicola]HDZ9770080.1 hypothetical protein [Klebsiella variicola subsp. variicola]EKZ5860344.1 hypothetical protein [Klebsiella pneumoniae]ELA1955132.1 hypothetical protein [Klebsiella variicola]MBD7114481.1 hypothetical protein [Klebsiella pneumoniae]